MAAIAEATVGTCPDRPRVSNPNRNDQSITFDMVGESYADDTVGPVGFAHLVALWDAFGRSYTYATNMCSPDDGQCDGYLQVCRSQ